MAGATCCELALPEANRDGLPPHNRSRCACPQRQCLYRAGAEGNENESLAAGYAGVLPHRRIEARRVMSLSAKCKANGFGRAARRS
ncbi:hypothetical protein CBM2585_B70030 [Cupriavidus taiwanensis]|nr:hypothetical protein CBM2585_B70030 [Cupriavidus taiwanensis]SPC17477.1 hypothetical protein CT19431_MP150004 [Cupriavidus taiwanensis]